MDREETLKAIGLKPGDVAGDPFGNRKARRIAANAKVSRQAIPDEPAPILMVFVKTLQGWSYSDTGDRFTVRLAEGEIGRILVAMPDGRIAVFGSRDGVDAGEALWWTQSTGRFAAVRVLRHGAVVA